MLGLPELLSGVLPSGYRSLVFSPLAQVVSSSSVYGVRHFARDLFLLLPFLTHTCQTTTWWLITSLFSPSNAAPFIFCCCCCRRLSFTSDKSPFDTPIPLPETDIHSRSNSNSTFRSFHSELPLHRSVPLYYARSLRLKSRNHSLIRWRSKRRVTQPTRSTTVFCVAGPPPSFVQHASLAQTGEPRQSGQW
jgi:hypothetical protein